MFDTCIKIMFVCDLYYKGPGRWVQTSGSPTVNALLDSGGLSDNIVSENLIRIVWLLSNNDLISKKLLNILFT